MLAQTESRTKHSQVEQLRYIDGNQITSLSSGAFVGLDSLNFLLCNYLLFQLLINMTFGPHQISQYQQDCVHNQLDLCGTQQIGFSVVLSFCS
jgi:hypothetical protein